MSAYTWTVHTFRCRSCGRRARAAQEVIDAHAIDNGEGDVQIRDTQVRCVVEGETDTKYLVKFHDGNRAWVDRAIVFVPDDVQAEIVGGWEYCIACSDSVGSEEIEGEHIPECEGAQDEHGKAACTGENPRRYWFATPYAPTVQRPVVWCDECRDIAVTRDSFRVLPADSMDAPAPMDALIPSAVVFLGQLDAAIRDLSVRRMEMFARVREASTFEVIAILDRACGKQETRGVYDTIEEARGCVAYDRLEEWEIWQGDHIVEDSDQAARS